MERELAVGDLQISQTGSALGGGRPRALSALRGERRVVAISGSPGWLLAELRSAEVYRRRLEQSGVALVCVAFGEEAAWADASRAAEAAGWLWRPADASGWRGYFSDILTAKDGSAKAAAEEGAFFALSLRGRSCASGVGRVPWDELLGTKLPPIEPLSPSDPPAPASEEEAAVLAAQAALYDALRDVDAAAVRRLCSPEDDDEVSALAPLGRLDGWETALKARRRDSARGHVHDTSLGMSSLGPQVRRHRWLAAVEPGRHRRRRDGLLDWARVPRRREGRVAAVHTALGARPGGRLAARAAPHDPLHGARRRSRVPPLRSPRLRGAAADRSGRPGGHAWRWAGVSLCWAVLGGLLRSGVLGSMRRSSALRPPPVHAGPVAGPSVAALHRAEEDTVRKFLPRGH